jgi:type II secretory pathway component PulF
MRTSPKRTEPLSAEETRLLVDRLKAVSDTALPLASGLRSAASELRDGRLRAKMGQLADRIERGELTERTLRDELLECPPSLKGILAAALHSGRMSEVLGEYIEHQRLRRELVAALRTAVAYPIVLFLLCLALITLYSLFVLPDVQTAARLFTWNADPQHFLQWWSENGIWLLLTVLGAAAACLLLARLLLRRAQWQRLKKSIPLLGPLYHWTGLLEWSGMLRLLLSHGIPLAAALRWSSEGCSDAAIQQYGDRLAQEMEQGQSLSARLDAIRSMPGTLALLVRWGERTDQLPEALAAVCDYLEERARLHVVLLRLILPPITFTLVAVVLLVLFGSLFNTVLAGLDWLR